MSPPGSLWSWACGCGATGGPVAPQQETSSRLDLAANTMTATPNRFSRRVVLGVSSFNRRVYLPLVIRSQP